MAGLLTDENFPAETGEELKRRGHDVLTVREAGLANMKTPDADVLAYANEQDRMLLTLDWRDFQRLHNDGAPHAGIVICRPDADFAALADRIDSGLKQFGDIAGQLMKVDRAGPKLVAEPIKKPARTEQPNA